LEKRNNSVRIYPVSSVWQFTLYYIYSASGRIGNLVLSGQRVILDREDNMTSHNYTGNLAECISEGLRIIEEKDAILVPDGGSITEVLLRTIAIDRTAEGELLSQEALDNYDGQSYV
jgi:hypothetical protein